MMLYGHQYARKNKSGQGARNNQLSEYTSQDLATAHINYIAHLKEKLTTASFVDRQIIRMSITQHEDRKTLVEKTGGVPTTYLDTCAWQWWSQQKAKPKYKVNDAKDNLKRTQITENGIFQRRHSSDNNSCLFNAVINNIIHRIKSNLPLPKRFQQAFVVGLGTYKLTLGYHNHRLREKIANMEAFQDFKDTVIENQVNAKNLESIGNVILRQMIINAHTQLATTEAGKQHIRRAIQLSQYQNKIQGDDADLLALQETTDLQFEVYEQYRNDTVQLNVFLAMNNKPDCATIRLLHITSASNHEHLNHYDWLEIISEPSPIKAQKKGHSDTQIVADYANRVYTPIEAQALVKTRDTAQQAIANGADASDQHILNSHISAITYALSLHAIQQEHLALINNHQAASATTKNRTSIVLSDKPDVFANSTLSATSNNNAPQDSRAGCKI